MKPTIPALLRDRSRDHADRTALRYREGGERKEVTYGRLFEDVDRFSRALLRAGLDPGDRVLLFADNSPLWIVADLGIMGAGMVTVAQGRDLSGAEARRILDHSGARAAVVHDPSVLDRLPDGGARLAARVLCAGDREGCSTFSSFLEMGSGSRGPDGEVELAALVYTSGTTGEPKAVMLTHENILHNVRVLPHLLDIDPGDVFLSLLPSWHMFERTVEYTVLSRGATLSYSSLKEMRRDLAVERPTFLAAVPRLWQAMRDGVYASIARRPLPLRAFLGLLLKRTLAFTWRRLEVTGRVHFSSGRPRGRASLVPGFVAVLLESPFGLLGRFVVGRGVRAALGGRLKCGISGGGMLPLEVDAFFAAMGVSLLVGYGLTETSPVVTLRRLERNVLGTIGRPIPETQVRIVDPKGRSLAPGRVGEVEVRGPQVMSGYYRDPRLTEEVLRPGGWFRTGDLGALSARGDLSFSGRRKETIVLSNGENVEPCPIEARILESPYVSQALVVGQDQKALGALVVPGTGSAREAGVRGITVEELMRLEVQRLVSEKAGFPARERVTRVAVLPEELSVENGTLTRTLKPRRGRVLAKYSELIEAMYR